MLLLDTLNSSFRIDVFPPPYPTHFSAYFATFCSSFIYQCQVETERLPVTRMINDSCYPMGVVAAKAEAVTFLKALICSNTEYAGKKNYMH